MTLKACNSNQYFSEIKYSDLKAHIFNRIDLDKRKLIQIITVQGVLNKKKTPGPVLTAYKPGINRIRKIKAMATNQILSWSVAIYYSFEI